MEELIITKDMREKINNYLGYELIKENEVGHHIYDEAPGLGKIGIECSEHGLVVTNKQLDSNGTVEWFKTAHPKARPGEIKPFHCKLTSVSAQKAKVLIASLFPEEATDGKFLRENKQTIEELRSQLHIVKKSRKSEEKKDSQTNKLLLGPNEIFVKGANYMVEDEDDNGMLYGPNEMKL